MMFSGKEMSIKSKIVLYFELLKNGCRHDVVSFVD